MTRLRAAELCEAIALSEQAEVCSDFFLHRGLTTGEKAL